MRLFSAILIVQSYIPTIMICISLGLMNHHYTALNKRIVLNKRIARQFSRECSTFFPRPVVSSRLSNPLNHTH